MEALELINKNKNKIINIAVLIIALIIANNIYKSQAREAASLKGKIEVEVKKNAVLENISRQEKKVGSYKNLLSSKKNKGSVFTSIADIAKEAGVKIVSIRPSGEQRFADYVKLPFDLIIGADSYHAVGKFISAIENDRDAYIVIDLLDIRPKGQGKGVTANLRICSIELTK